MEFMESIRYYEYELLFKEWIDQQFYIYINEEEFDEMVFLKFMNNLFILNIGNYLL